MTVIGEHYDFLIGRSYGFPINSSYYSKVLRNKELQLQNKLPFRRFSDFDGNPSR